MKKIAPKDVETVKMLTLAWMIEWGDEYVPRRTRIKTSWYWTNCADMVDSYGWLMEKQTPSVSMSETPIKLSKAAKKWLETHL